MEQEYVDIVESKNRIAERLIDSISIDEFDINVDLSDFSVEELKNFYFDISAFNIISNNDSFESVFDESVLDNIVNGKFVLRKFSLQDGKSYADVHFKKYSSSISFKLKENHIQDGIFYFVKESDRRGARYYSLLETNSPKLLTAEKIDRTQCFTPKALLDKFRNIIAHSNYIVSNPNEGTISFKNNKFEFVCSQMWLRGLGTLWSSRHKNLDYFAIKNAILTEYGKGKKTIASEDDIKNMLNLTASYTDYKKSGTTASRIYTLMKNRLNLYGDFFAMKDENGKEDFDRKIDIFINIIENNSTIIENGKFTINSKVCYNIQQIIADEINKKMSHPTGVVVSSNFNVKQASQKLENAQELSAELKEVEKELTEHLDKLDRLGRVQKQIYYNKNQSQIKALEKKREAILKRSINVLNDLEKDVALETGEMKLFNKESVANMPIETAVNLVAFRGYNRFISSGFYKNILDPEHDLTKNEINAILNMDFSEFVVAKRYDGNRREVKLSLEDPDKKTKLENRLLFLRRLRHATSHGLITYSLPANPKDKNWNKNVVMNYNGDGENNIRVSGSISAFNKLFKNDFFKPVSTGGRTSRG